MSQHDDNKEYVYEVKFSVVIGVDAPPDDPDIKAILGENALEYAQVIVETCGYSDLVDSFELLDVTSA